MKKQRLRRGVFLVNCGMHVFPDFEFYACGDHGFTLDFGQQIDININGFVIHLFHQLQKNRRSYILDIIPAYSSITVVYNPLSFTKCNTNPESVIHEYFTNAILQTENIQATASVDIIRIPVCYHPSLAPDLEPVCKYHNIDIDTLVTLHTQKTYRVFMNGFLPGFAYMGTVDDRIATARHSNPRKKVAAGSLGIAGNQTGIYPFESPGGWQLIGRTSVSLFDLHSDNPCLLKPGDQVQFYSIPIESFQS
jgi:inhibitor of KinA